MSLVHLSTNDKSDFGIMWRLYTVFLTMLAFAAIGLKVHELLTGASAPQDKSLILIVAALITMGNTGRVMRSSWLVNLGEAAVTGLVTTLIATTLLH